jgi:RHS repeat-associated protein
MDRAAHTYYYHQNALWSVEAITDSVTNPVERSAYDAYGFVTVTDGASTPVPPNAWGTPHSAISNPYLFTGRQFDEETGLSFYRARYYDNMKGRFLQRDPLAYVDGVNLYQYVQCNPVNRFDPLGTRCGECTPGSPNERNNKVVLVVASKSENVSPAFDKALKSLVSPVIGPLTILAAAAGYVEGSLGAQASEAVTIDRTIINKLSSLNLKPGDLYFIWFEVQYESCDECWELLSPSTWLPLCSQKYEWTTHTKWVLFKQDKGTGKPDGAGDPFVPGRTDVTIDQLNAGKTAAAQAGATPGGIPIGK